MEKFKNIRGIILFVLSILVSTIEGVEFVGRSLVTSSLVLAVWDLVLIDKRWSIAKKIGILVPGSMFVHFLAFSVFFPSHINEAIVGVGAAISLSVSLPFFGSIKKDKEPNQIEIGKKKKLSRAIIAISFLNLYAAYRYSRYDEIIDFIFFVLTVCLLVFIVVKSRYTD